MKGQGEQERSAAVDERRRPDMVPFEMNLEDPPLFATQARNLDRGAVEFIEEYKTEDGRVAQRRWKLQPPEEYGDLGVFDQDVYMAVSSLVQMMGGMPADGLVPFTIYEIVQLLGLPTNGKHYSKVRDSILRIGKTLIDADNAFYSKKKLSWKSEHFIIWRVSFEANVDRHGRAAERHTLRFDEVVVRSHRAGYIKPLDVNFYLSLDRPHAKSLYRRIDHKRGEGLVWSVKLHTLKELLGMAPSYRYPSKVKEKLGPSHEELVRKGFLRSVTYGEADVVRYEVSRDFVSERAHLDRAWTYEENAAIRKLIKNGVWANVAPELVAGRGADLCNYYVDALPYQRGVRKSGAWLTKYIGEGLPLPIEPPQRRLEEAQFPSDGKDGAKGTIASHPEPDSEVEDLWKGVVEAVGEEVETPSVTVWLEGCVPTGLKGDRLTLAVPNAFAKEYVEEHFGPLVESALKERLSEGASLQVVVGGEEPGSGGSGAGRG